VPGRVAPGGPFVLEAREGRAVRAVAPVEVPLLAKPTATVEVGRCAYEAEAPVVVEGWAWLNRLPDASRLQEARELDPDRTVDFGSVRRLAPESPGEAGVPARVEAGTVVDRLLRLDAPDDADEALCLYRVGGRVVRTPCWDDDEVAGVESWVLTRCDGAAGWLRVDDREELVSGA
jgi:hypothetical protein